IYEVRVRSFFDSDGDGIGDFTGLASRLDHLQDLGVTAIWLLPFYPSPLRDDGYDTADYYNVHPAYGTLRDFRKFLREAHGRGLKVVTELVINHTSDQHPWFQRARRSPPGSAARDFYVWSDDPEKYRETRIIFKDFEPSNWTYDHVAQAYYWHRFYAHQPDLNWDNPAVKKAMLQVLDFWFGTIGVDGLRLDAVPYLFEREGTNCENLPETHAALREIRRHVDEHHRDKMLLAEANQWPEDAVAYFGQGDECHTAFHFPIMPRLFMGVRREDRFPITDIWAQTPAIHESCQWVLFLRNHDELTLEMVTDEERDYMYRVYAEDRQARINLGIRRRLAPLLGNSRRKIELMKGLLLSLPGTPVLYYGDEIGMGDNFYLGDRNGVRTPMQWSPDRNAGFSRANSQKLYLPVIIDPEYHYEAVNVEVQQNNPQSLLWWMKRVLSLRRQFKAFGRGTFEFVHADNGKVLAFVRSHEGEQILVVANLSRFAQHAELPLAAYKGRRPVELFGRTPFPVIGDTPYSLALGPHTFYWFSLELPGAAGATRATAEVPEIVWEGTLEELLAEANRGALEAALPALLATRAWYRGLRRTLQWTEIRDVVPLSEDGFAVFVSVEYTEGEPETYLLTLMHATGRIAAERTANAPASVLARLRGRSGADNGLLVDGAWDRQFAESVLALMGRRSARGTAGELEGESSFPIRRARPEGAGPLTIHDRGAHTSVVFGTRFVLRLLRRVEEGPHPDIEVGRYLTEEAKFQHVPPFLGQLEYARGRTRSAVVASLHGYVPSESDAWLLTADELGRYFERVLAAGAQAAAPAIPAETILELAIKEAPPEARALISGYLDLAALLGQRTAELHLALAAAPGADFAPEPFSELYLRSLVQSMRNVTRQVMQRLRRHLKDIPEAARPDAQKVLGLEGEIVRRTRAAFSRRLSGLRTRYHGNLHLGQVLYTGRDFVILMSEGEAVRSLADRRIKRSPLRDVAALLRSWHYASAHMFAVGVSVGSVRREDLPTVQPWARYWRTWVAAAFLRRYLDTAAAGAFLPRPEDLRDMLTAYLLEKALYELASELETRPDWARIPLLGILELVEGHPG
ncbi:MAG TPA: maltose alpha-D-glucosyltransferase, partial [Vicinamibacteria bacterium]|nr:maltose alpha-D-glucosyltransferase [Vicinamibacteria bacterium]